MGLLILMRHAKSDYPAGVPDHDRPLAARGRREAPLMAPLLAAELADPAHTLTLVSSAERARATWEAVSASMADEIAAAVTPELYESSPATIARCIREAVAPAQDVDAIIVVAHNPGLHEAVHEWSEARLERFPTSAFAVLECDAAWDAFPRQRVRLRSFHIAR